MSISNAQVQSLLDLSVGSSTNGTSIPIVYGTMLVPGNLIWVKGGSLNSTSQVLNKQDYFTYSATMAVAFCEGSATIVRIYGDNAVLYDSTGTYVDYVGEYSRSNVWYTQGEIVHYDPGSGGATYWMLTGDFAPSRWTGNNFPVPGNSWQWTPYSGSLEVAGGQQYPSPTLYSGTDTQPVDPAILRSLSANNASAFRGLCYAVWGDGEEASTPALDLTNFGNRIPSMRAVIVGGTPTYSPPGSTSTSSLSYIVSDVFERSGIDSSLVDVSDLDHVTTTIADTYQEDGSGIPALSLARGGKVYFYQSNHQSGVPNLSGAPWKWTFPNTDSNHPLPPARFTWTMPDTASILWNPFPSNEAYASLSYGDFLPGWGDPDPPSVSRLPMGCAGVVSGGAGAATWSGEFFSPWTPANWGDAGQANFDMVISCKLNVAVAGIYTFKCSSNDSVIIGIEGAIRISGPLVFSTQYGAPSVMTKTALNGFPICFAENVVMRDGHSDHYLTPDPSPGTTDGNSVLSTFVVYLPQGTWGVEVDYSCHVDDRCLNLNWMMGHETIDGVGNFNSAPQSPLLPIAPASAPEVFGFIIDEQKDARSILDDLRSAYFWDLCESDFKLKAVKRGAHAPVPTISEDDLGLVDDKKRLVETTVQSQDAPKTVVINYLNADDPMLQQGSQLKSRNSRVVTTQNQTTIDLTKLAISGNEARSISEISLYESWISRSPWEINLAKPSYLLLDPCDIVPFVYEGQVYTQRLNTVSVGQNYAVKTNGVSYSPLVYTSVAPAASSSPVVVAVGYPLGLENGSGDLLLESDTNGGRILLEGGIVTPPTPPPPPPPPTPITPTYETTFSTAPSDWTATDASGVEGGGSFSSSHIDYSQGCLRLTLTGDSTTAGNVGAELVSNATFPYGTYEFSMRAASDCATPSGTGNVYSGSISACFNFMNDSETEIDCPEIQGQSPQRVEFTNWLGSTNNQWTPVDVTYQPHQGFHLYKFIWSASSIEFYIDGALQCTHTVYVPSTSARIIINLWGTNSTDFGGTATSATRYMYINSVKFLAA